MRGYDGVIDSVDTSATSSSSAADPQAVLEPRPQRGTRTRRPAFWNAVAGMAVALALGCGVVAMEFAAESGHRASYLRHRVDLLLARSRLMQSHLLVAEREIAALRNQAVARREFGRILAAPDGRVIHLEPLNHQPGPAAVIGVSPRLAAAVLEASGLPLLGPDQRYSLSWVPRRGSMISAKLSAPVTGGLMGGAVQVSAPPADPIAIVLMLETETGGKWLRSPLMRGEFHPQVKR